MTSREVNKLIREGEAGVAKLYKLHEKEFNTVDEWAEKLTNGDLLDEYEIAQCMERLTGCLMKFGTVAGALESLKEEMEHGCRVTEFGKIEKVRSVDTDIVKALGRDHVAKIRKWATDFRNYFYSAQSGVTTSQSRLKRLTVEKGAKRVDRTGEQPIESNTDSNIEKKEEKNEW